MLINIWFNRKDVKTLNRPSHPTQSTYESNCPFHFCERIHTAIKMASAEHVLTLRSSKTWISLFLHQIWRNVAFHQLLTNGSSAVNGCQRHRFCLLNYNWWTGVVRITCGLLWCFYQLFGLSFWRHPFTAEDPLLSEWWNATFLQICKIKTIDYLRKIMLYYSFPVAQMVEHGASNAKIMGSIPRESKSW